jgi:hypothetical protein
MLPTDAEKLRELRESLALQEKRLEELKQKHKSSKTKHPDEQEHHAVHNAIVSATQTIRSLIDILSEAGL